MVEKFVTIQYKDRIGIQNVHDVNLLASAQRLRDGEITKEMYLLEIDFESKRYNKILSAISKYNNSKL